jgi:hypothetical protein
LLLFRGGCAFAPQALRLWVSLFRFHCQAERRMVRSLAADKLDIADAYVREVQRRPSWSWWH